jgi:menaquinone-9 beta-reductase
MRRVRALIVGGGPAGAAAAITLARGGIAAELIERQAGPHEMVCGGFLGWDALAALERLGVDAGELGARPIRRLRLVSAARVVETALPRPAAGLSRRRLDAALLGQAASAGAAIRLGLTARAANHARRVRLDDDEEIEADALFLATGKHELRGLGRPVPERRGKGAVGLRTSFMPDAAEAATLNGRIELHPFDGGYAGLLLQEDGSVNLCMSVAADRLRDAGGIDPLLVDLAREAPRLGGWLAAARAQAARWLSISNVPYGWRARTTTSGLFRVGDQSAVIASLAGDGIAIALTSGIAAAQAHLAGRPAPAYQRDWERQARQPLRVAEALRWSAERPLPRKLVMRLTAAAPPLARLAARLTRIEAEKPALSGR